MSETSENGEIKKSEIVNQERKTIKHEAAEEQLHKSSSKDGLHKEIDNHSHTRENMHKAANHNRSGKAMHKAADNHSHSKNTIHKTEDIDSSARKSVHRKKSKKNQTFIEKIKDGFENLSVSQVAIAALTCAIIVVAAVTLVVIFKTNKANKENLAKAEESAQQTTEDNDNTDDTATVEEDTSATVAPVDIPSLAEYTIKSQSTVKDLTLIFQGSDKKKISGTEFKVKLVDAKTAKKLDSSISALKADNENLLALKDKQSEISALSDDASSSTTDSKQESSANSKSSSNSSSSISSTKSEDSSNTAGTDTDNQTKAEKMQAVNDEITKAISKRDEDIKSYNKAFESLKGTTYTDKDKDGMIYIKSIDGGNYVAVAESTDNLVATSYTTKVAVKDKADYKPIEDIKDKVVSEKVAGDTKEEKPAVEATVTDTVEWVESSQDKSGAYEKTTAPALAVAKSSGFNTAKGKYTGTPKSKGFFYRKGYLVAEGDANNAGNAAGVAVKGINLNSVC